MSASPALLASAANQLQKIFEVDNLAVTDGEALLRKLSRVVQHMLRTDFNRLLHILYRVDVEEQKVKQAMLAETEEEIAERVAQLIIKRELQKAQTRFMYRS